MKKIVIITLIGFAGFMGSAQNSTMEYIISTGISKPLLDNGFGFQLGINPKKSFGDHLILEGQISHNRTKITGTFLSGNEGLTASTNLLLGVRLDAAPIKWKQVHLFVNILAGGVLYNETISEVAAKPQIHLGYSIGAFAEYKNFVAGVSLESYVNMVFKFGYIFKRK